MILTGDVNLMSVTDPGVPFALVKDEFRTATLFLATSNAVSIGRIAAIR